MAINRADPNLKTEQLLRDAEEALARERMADFWRNYGATIIAAALMLVVGTAAGTAWKAWKANDNEKNTAALLAVLDGKSDDFGALAGNHAAMARLMDAQTALADTKTDKALVMDHVKKLYGETASSRASGKPWQNLAQWNVLRLEMDNPNADPKDLIADLTDLSRRMEGDGFAAMPLIDAAIIAGERLNDNKQAIDLLNRADSFAPRGTGAATLVDDLRHLYTMNQPATPAEKAAP